MYDGSVTRQLEKMRDSAGRKRHVVGHSAEFQAGGEQGSENTTAPDGAGTHPDQTKPWTSKQKKSSKIIRDQIGSYAVDVDVAEVGTIVSIGDGIARVHGVEKTMAGEMLEFPHGVFGIALNLEEDSVGAVLLGDYTEIQEGDTVKRTGRIISVPVGDELIGRVVNALGQPIDGKGPIVVEAVRCRSSASRPASSIASRSRSRCRPASRPSTRWCRSAAASAS